MDIRKCILLLFVGFLLSGCSIDYKLEISENGFYESFDIVAGKNDGVTEYAIPTFYGAIDLEDVDANFLEKQSGIIYYNSKVYKQNNLLKVSYDYKFDTNEFGNSNAINSAYDNVVINNYDHDGDGKKDYMMLSTSNKFLLFDKFEKIDNLKVDIKCEFEVISSNADEVNDGVYTWYMTPDNVKAINMIYNPDKVVDYRSFWDKLLDGEYFNIFSVSVVLLVIGIIIYLFVKSREKRVNKV